MNLVKRITEYFESKHITCVVSVMQVVKSQNYGDTVHFYVFIDSNLEYLATTYKSNSIKRMEAENEVMAALVNRLSDIETKQSILFSFELLKIGNSCVRIQKYIDIQKIRRQNKSLSHNLAMQYLERSFNWVKSFQYQNSSTVFTFRDLVIEMEEMKGLVQQNQYVLEKFQSLEPILSSETASLTKGFSHGDFCYYNYFINNNNQFFVYDWEHVSTNYWSFYDPVLNLNVIWNHFYNKKKAGNMHKVLCLNKINSTADELLFGHAETIARFYSLNLRSVALLSVFTYYRNLLREGKYSIMESSPGFLDIDSLLNC